jgi:hypothetical protein
MRRLSARAQHHSAGYPSETGDWPDGRGAKMTGAAQPNHDLRGQKRMGDSQNLDLKGHGAAARRAVGSAT